MGDLAGALGGRIHAAGTSSIFVAEKLAPSDFRVFTCHSEYKTLIRTKMKRSNENSIPHDTMIRDHAMPSSSSSPSPSPSSSSSSSSIQLPGSSSLPTTTFLYNGLILCDIMHLGAIAPKKILKHQDEAFLIEIRRSLLENQYWASTRELASNHGFCRHVDGITDTHIESGNSSSVNNLQCPSSTHRRLSARERRLLAKKWPRKSSHHAITSRVNHKPNHNPICSTISGVTSRKVPSGLTGNFTLDSINTLVYMRGRKRELLTKEQEVVLSKKMKVGQNLRNARKTLTTMLGYEPSNELWAMSVKLSLREVQTKLLEADRAREQVFICNLRLVVSIARKYAAFGVNLTDLIQEGAMGLLRGLEKFDHKKGFKLSTYVHWWIRQSITQALAQNSKTVRIPSYMYGKLMLLNKTMERLRRHGKPVSIETLASTLNMPEEMVSVALKATKKMVSLDKPKRWRNFNSADDSLHNFVADPCYENNPWHVVDNMYLKGDLDDLLTWTLPEREQEIIRMYHGLHCPDGHGMSFAKIGHRIGISRERARQLEGTALRKLGVASQEIGMGIPLSS